MRYITNKKKKPNLKTSKVTKDKELKIKPKKFIKSKNKLQLVNPILEDNYNQENFEYVEKSVSNNEYLVFYILTPISLSILIWFIFRFLDLHI